MQNGCIPDDFAEYLRHLKEASAAGPTTGEQEAEPAGPTRFVDIKVYDLHPGEQVTPPGIESSLAPEAAPEKPDAPQPDEPEADGEIEETPPIAPIATQQRIALHPLALASIGAALMLAIGGSVWYLLPMLAPPVTVTIVPVSKAITATGTVTVVTGPANPARQEIPGCLLSTISMSQERRVPTTGTGYQEAQSAHGTITFYNAAPTPQTVSAGTLLTGADGVQVVTNAQAIIPGAVPPTEGQASVPAHAVVAGPAGNIGAHDIYGPCCRLNVFAANSAFTGGQVERRYPTVTAHDVSAVAESLETSLTVSMQAAFLPQVRSDETLIVPLPCQPTVTPDHQIGTEAGLVQVTVSLTCTGEVYQTHAYTAQVAQMVTHAAAQQLGAGYQESGPIQSSITATTYRPHGTVTLAIKGAGTWTYQITAPERAAMVQTIAGKSKAQATAFLLAMPGVQSAAIDEQNSDQLPPDPNRIQVMIVTY